MIKTAFAMALATLVFVAVSGTSQAAPIAPLTGTDTGSVTQVYWHGGWHRGWHRGWGGPRRWCYYHPRAC